MLVTVLGMGDASVNKGQILQSRPAQVLKKTNSANKKTEQLYIRINPVKDVSKVAASEITEVCGAPPARTGKAYGDI